MPTDFERYSLYFFDPGGRLACLLSLTDLGICTIMAITATTKRDDGDANADDDDEKMGPIIVLFWLTGDGIFWFLRIFPWFRGQKNGSIVLSIVDVAAVALSFLVYFG